MKTQPRHSTRPQRGLALLSVIGLLLVLLVFAGGMVAQLAMEVSNVKAEAVSNRALAAADAGVHAMVEQIQSNQANSLPPPSGAITYTYPEPSGTDATVKYSATIDQTWPADGLNYYLITSTGTYNNGLLPKPQIQTRRVRAIARSQPISAFSSFSNYETNNFNKPVWYRPDTHFDGPVYSGGPMRIDYAGSGINPIFLSTVRTPNTPVWIDDADPGLPPAPSDANDWGSIIKDGASSFVIDKNPLSLPQGADNLLVMSQAFEGDAAATTFPTVPNGLYMNKKDAGTQAGATLTSGMYVNVNGGTVSVEGSSVGSTETLKFTSSAAGFGQYVVTENFTGICTGSTKVVHTVGGVTSTGTFSGVPCGAPGPATTNPGNGAVYVNGNITLGTGANPDVTLQGDYTFATPDYAGPTRTITMLGNLLYADATKDETALWSNKILLNSGASNLTIDASLIAGWPGEPAGSGYFAYAGCNATNCGTKDQGTLTVNGGIIENTRGAVGAWVGTTHTGFSRIINFDKRFMTNPPPFNPTTGAYNLIAWEDLGT